MMIQEVLEALTSIEMRLEGWCGPHKIPATRNQDATLISDRLGHLLWMISEVRTWAGAKPDKAHRWLGFIQGSLWVLGIQSIEDSKKQDMPASETFDKERI